MTPTFAKNRARLLREDLASAGFEIAHSLALELVAHQNGFADWNTLAASDARRREAEPHLERETYEHTSPTMTLGDLRAVGNNHPDRTPVYVSRPTEPGSTTTESLPAHSAVVRNLGGSGRQPVLLVEGTYPTGQYLVPRWLVLALTGTSGGQRAVSSVIDTVEAAVEDLGLHGAHEMRNDTEAGTVTWRFQSHKGVPLNAIEAAIRSIVRRQNPGGWILTSR